CAPGSAGVANLAECVPIAMGALQTILSHCDDQDIEFVIVDSLVAMEAGLVDMLNRNGYPSFGPDMGGVKLEISKHFAKEFCKRHTIPTAAWRHFTDADSARLYLSETGFSVVIKGDSYINGAKVAICRTKDEAEAAIAARFSGDGIDGIIIEELLTGQEISYSAITDGNVVLPLTTTTPFWDGAAVPSMPGCLSPAPGVTPEIEQEIVDRILLPTVEHMKAERKTFRGLLHANIVLTSEGPKLLDYKVRLPDPEWQAIMLRMKGDLMPALVSSYDEMLYRFNPFRWHEESAMVAVITTDGKVDPEGISAAVDAAEEADGDIVVFQSYADRELGVTASGKDLDDVRKRLLAATDRIKEVLAKG
ncbi:MAG TPA: phosphoribosylamine--glycine ligase, partial [Beijerinckia sp.]|nr:phosphoribosylamine--glycine ligase [Beijerinckia sp.]